VELKGTQTRGKTLILTSGEVRHVRKYADQCILVLIHSVNVSGKRTVSVSGGSAEVSGEPRFTAFDLLWCNGEDLKSLTLSERKQRLRSVVRSGSERLLYCDHDSVRATRENANQVR